MSQGHGARPCSLHFALGPPKAGIRGVRVRFVISGGSWDGVLAGPLPGLRVGASLLLGISYPTPRKCPSPQAFVH